MSQEQKACLENLVDRIRGSLQGKLKKEKFNGFLSDENFV
jgi:hypothetical protein